MMHRLVIHTDKHVPVFAAGSHPFSLTEQCLEVCLGLSVALALLVVALLVLLEGLSFATSSNNSSALDVFFFDDDFGVLFCVDFCGVVCRDERRVGVAIIYTLFSLSLSENALVEK